jgi:hypothetical protein
MRRWIPLVVMPIVLAGCASLTPEQSARLNEANQFADEVTTAYGARRVQVVVNTSDLGYTGYWPDHDWIALQPTDLDGSARLQLVDYLAMATILTPSASNRRLTWEEVQPWRWRYEVNRRGVEIIVKFLGMSTRQAVDLYAATFIALVQSNGPQAPLHLGPETGRRSGPPWWSPCDQLRDLWSHFAITDPAPACGVSMK